jgi:hypothetical protein
VEPLIRITRLRADIDMVTLRIEARDAVASLENEIHVGHGDLRDTVTGLQAFREQVHGGTYTLRFGTFGPGWASGAFEARLQFRPRGKIFARVSVQSEFRRFQDIEFASEAVLHLLTEPALLDDFTAGLEAIRDGAGDVAELRSTFFDCLA